jgi:hypothetical protein
VHCRKEIYVVNNIVAMPVMLDWMSALFMGCGKVEINF